MDSNLIKSETKDDSRIINFPFGNLISTLGGYTFYIYLIHYLFTNHFRATGLEAAFKAFFGETSLGLILYSLIYSLFIFAFCSILIYIAELLIKIISAAIKKH